MILSLDIETWASRSFAVGVIYNPQDNTHKVFFSARKIREYILSLVDKRKRADKITLLGHNISYDLNFIFDNVEMFFKNEWKNEDGKNRKGEPVIKRRYYKKLIARDGNLYEAKLYNLKFLDTYNIFRASLEVAGKVVGYDKDIDKRKKFETTKTPGKITKEDIKYCLGDCIITYNIYDHIKKWVEGHGGELKRTFSATAVSILQKYNPDIKIYLEQMNKYYRLSELDEGFRKGYFGGRTETHYKKGFNLKYYDINSLYPYVMSGDKFKYPQPDTLFLFRDSMEKALRKYEGVATIKIYVPDDIKIPVLPHRVKNIEGVSDGKIIYPKGAFWGTWCFPEIRLALSMGCYIIDTGKIICGHRIDSPFRKYQETLYSERLILLKSGDKSEDVIKFFMNGCYGKFGQSDYENRIISLPEADVLFQNGEIYQIIYYKGEPFVKYSTKPKRSRADLLCLASYVTSYARCEIYGWYKKVDYDIYYSDTDSLITSKVLPTGEKMGEMKLEADIIEGSFKGRKDYYLHCSKIYKKNKILENKGIVKRKGFSLKFVTSLKIGNEWIDVDDVIKQGLVDKNPSITKLYHVAETLELDKILKSREALIRGKQASHICAMTKSRVSQFDDGKIWTNDELSIPYIIHQEDINSSCIIRVD